MKNQQRTCWHDLPYDVLDTIGRYTDPWILAVLPGLSRRHHQEWTPILMHRKTEIEREFKRSGEDIVRTAHQMCLAAVTFTSPNKALDKRKAQLHSILAVNPQLTRILSKVSSQLDNAAGQWVHVRESSIAFIFTYMLYSSTPLSARFLLPEMDLVHHYFNSCKRATQTRATLRVLMDNHPTDWTQVTTSILDLHRIILGLMAAVQVAEASRERLYHHFVVSTTEYVQFHRCVVCSMAHLMILPESSRTQMDQNRAWHGICGAFEDPEEYLLLFLRIHDTNIT